MHGKQLVESNDFIKKGFNIDKNAMSLEEPKKILIELVDGRSSEFMNLKKSNSDNFIYKYKTEGIRF